MKGKYEVVFVLPLGAEKELTDSGWEFRVSNYIPSGVKEELVECFDLVFFKSYLGIELYLGRGVELSVFLVMMVRWSFLA